MSRSCKAFTTNCSHRKDGALNILVITSLPETLFFLVLSSDALLSNKGTKFSLISFRVLFRLVFAGTALVVLQVVLACHGVGEQDEKFALYTTLFAISFIKLFTCNFVRSSDLQMIVPPTNNCFPIREGLQIEMQPVSELKVESNVNGCSVDCLRALTRKDFREADKP